jgi:hypothetical protein
MDCSRIYRAEKMRKQFIEHPEICKNRLIATNMGNDHALGTHRTAEFLKTHRLKIHGINKGVLNGNYKGGITRIAKRIKDLPQYRKWRHTIFNRDKYSCCECNKVGGYLHAHHIKRMKKIIEENNIQFIEQAYICKELWDVNNGVTLCVDCHKDKHPDVNVLKKFPKRRDEE